MTARRQGDRPTPSWQTWVPLGLVVVSLLALAVVPDTAARRVARLQQEVSQRVTPVRNELHSFGLAFAREVLAFRAWALTGDAGFADEYRRSAEEANRSLEAATRRLSGTDLAPIAAELRSTLDGWRGTVREMMESRTGRADPLADLSNQQRRANAVLELTSRLDRRLGGWEEGTASRMQLESRRQAYVSLFLAAVALAATVAVAMLSRQARRQARQLRYRAQEERALRDVARTLSAAVTAHEVTQRVVQAAIETTRGFGAYVEEARAGEVEVVAVAGKGVPPLATRAPFPGSLTEGLLGSGEATVMEVGAIGESMVPYLAGQCDACTGLVVPLLGGGNNVLGTLVILRSSEQEPFGPDEVRHAQALGDLVSSALGRVQLLEQTERERKEKTALLESTAQGMWGVDRAGRSTFVNTAASRMLGFSAEELLGQAVHPLVHHTRADGSPYPESECPMTRVMATRERALIAGELLWRKDGTSFLADYSAAPIIVGDEVRGAVVSFTDATERHRREREMRESEEQFRALAENAAAAILVMRHDDEIVFANPGTHRVFGYGPDELIGRPLSSLMPADLRESHRNGVKRFLATGQRHLRWEGVELVGMRKDGSVVPLEITMGTFVRDGVPYFVGIAQDITARKKAETERIQLLASERTAREKAESAVRTRDEVLAIVSHDLRNPLNTISLAVAALESGDVPAEDTARTIPVVRRAVERMNRLIADLLDVARLEGGQKLTIQAEPLDIRAVVAETCDGQAAEAERKGLHLDCRIEDGLPRVSGDKHRLIQVLANLVGNALKFTGEGGHVRVMARRDDAGQVEVSVADSGAGIAPEHLAQVFNPYWQARQTARLGAGLGLAIAKGIVEAHGGRIWATSTPGTGSTFAFSLPALEPKGAEAAKAAETARS
ncbi:MAG TPA: PAS domain S-box protein [Vicinamibacteria bacterium]|nr:PAS domain S-box protein [Vicinamibacteria bacterium]